MKSILFAIVAIVASSMMIDGVANNPTELFKNIPVNGTLEKGATLSFVFKGKVDWRFYAFGSRVDSSESARGTHLANAVYKCGEEKIEMSLVNGIPTTRYNDPVLCEAETTLTLTSIASVDIHYWTIIAYIDTEMYRVESGVDKSVTLPGRDKHEYALFSFYIGKDDEHGGSVDVVNVTVRYDAFATTKVRAIVSDSMRPETREYSPLRAQGDTLFLSISRRDKFFCHDCRRYLMVLVDTPGNDFIDLSANVLVDRGLITLPMDETTTGSVMPDVHGQQFLIDLRNLEVDSDIYLGLRKINEPNVTLTVDISKTSFDDGEWDICKSTQLFATGLREWSIRRTDDCFRVGGVYYIRVTSDPSATNPCEFTITPRITRVDFQYLYTGKQHRFVSRGTDVGIGYYRVKIPSEEFVDVQSMTVKITDIQYTWNPGPVYCFGFNAYMGEQSSVVYINNPRDPLSYTFTDRYSAGKQYDVTITENQEGWCSDCTFGFSIRTTNETQWTITAELGYVPYTLKPNEAKRGTLHAFTGGVESQFYLHQSSYRPIEIVLKRIKESDPDVTLFVSTTPHPSITNHFWTDNTSGDGQADITISNDHPQFCTDCYYYIGMFYINDSSETKDVELELAVNCPDGVCRGCETGFDPATNCKDCLPNYYGGSCTPCKPCNHGTCLDGIAGNGECLCDEGWGPADQCVQCLEGYWGLHCTKCESCHEHGTCSSGLHGTGECKCDTNFDSATRCSDCKKGYFGFHCEGECPKTEEKICSDHGTCSDRMEGTGHCQCSTGYVGLKCDTEYMDDKCKPHCIVGRGGCDEEKGVCVCYEGFTGKDCGGESSLVWYIISLAAIGLVFILVAVLIIMYCNEGSVKRKRTRGKNAERDALLSQ